MQTLKIDKILCLLRTLCTKPWPKRKSLLIIVIAFIGQPLTSIADEYIESSLCGWGGLNADPCKDVRVVKIYTAVPSAGSENIESMGMLNSVVSMWIKDNKVNFDNKSIKVDLLNLWRKHHYPAPPHDEMISVAIFMYLSEKASNLVFSSTSVKSTQILSYSCNSESISICVPRLVDVGMRGLLKDLLNPKIHSEKGHVNH